MIRIRKSQTAVTHGWLDLVCDDCAALVDDFAAFCEARGLTGVLDARQAAA